MTDYWLSKLFYDVQAPALRTRWRADREAVLEDYPLAPEIRRAVLDDDIAVLAPRVNAYLLRFYMTACGMEDDEALARLHALKPADGGNRETPHHG